MLSPAMARRPEMRTNMMSRTDFCHVAHYRSGCGMGYFPSAHAIQRLAQARKQVEEGSA